MRSLIDYRRYIVVNALTEVRTRFAGTAFGWFWIITPPIALIAIYAAVFSSVMPIKPVTVGGAGPSYVLFLASGLLPWVAFSECLSRGANTFIESAPYLRKLAIPEEVFVARTSLAALIGLFVSLLVLMAFAVLFGHYPHPSWLWLPVIGLLLIGFGFGISSALAALNVFFRDVSQALGIFLQIWFWLLPIVYVEEIIPDALRAVIQWNPVLPYLRAIRSVFLAYEGPALTDLAIMAAISVGSAGIGIAVVKKLRPEIRDAI